MSQDNVVRVVVGVPTPSGSTDGVLASGVLVAPDEVLTAAHVVDATDGGQRTIGYVVPGYSDGSTDLPWYAVSDVHANPAYVMGDGTLANAAEDLGLIHLSAPVVGVKPMDLATALQGGFLSEAGYPNGTGNAYDEASGAFSASDTTDLLTGQALGEGGDPHGASGGPLWGTRDGRQAVVGLMSAVEVDPSGELTDTGLFKAPDGADVAMVRGWIADDHPGTNPSGDLGALGDALASDAAGRVGGRQGVMYEVANALILGASHGYMDLADGLTDVATELRGTAAPGRSLAYLAGMATACAGAPASDAAATAAALFPVAAASPFAASAEAAGHAEALGLLGTAAPSWLG